MRKKKKKKVRKGRGKVPGARVSEGVGLELAESESETGSCRDSDSSFSLDSLSQSILDWCIETIQNDIKQIMAKREKNSAHQKSRKARKKNKLIYVGKETSTRKSPQVAEFDATLLISPWELKAPPPMQTTCA